MSNYSSRDRKALTWGAVGVAAILAFNYVISPVWQRWSETGDLLASREAFVASFRERVDARDGLRARRDVLAMRLGSLRVLHDRVEAKGPDAKPEKDGGKPRDGKKDGKAPDGESPASKAADGQPADGEKAPDAAESAKPEKETETGTPVSAGSPPQTTESGPGSSVGEKASPPASEAPAPDSELVVARNKPEAPEGAGGEAPVTSEASDGSAKDEKKPDEAKAEPDKDGASKPDAKPDKDAASKPDAKPGEAPEAAKDGAADGAADGEKSAKPARAAVPVIEASSLATYVEKNAMAAKIKIKRITPKKGASGKKGTKYFEPVTLQVSFECQITNLVQLLHDLEKGELFVRVDKLEITRDVAQGDKLNASLDLSSYEPIGGTS